MSFQEQERALFDLLFDSELRENFCKDATAALAAYELDAGERDDFAVIRPDALVLDAKMRRHILLTHICRVYPLSFAIVSSFTNGKAMLKKLVDTKTMRAPSLDRATVFGTRLRDELATHSFDTPAEQALVIAIVEVELAMALTGASLKREAMENGLSPDEPTPLAEDWQGRTIKLAAYVAAAIIPRPYAELRQAFCVVADTELWTHLGHTPLTKSTRKATLKTENPRLFVIRARIKHDSQCQATVSHQTAELSDGFAPLLQHANGSSSVGEILGQLKVAGAPDKILQGVQSGFKQLLEAGMLEVVI